jgi:hypothetical protein
MKVSGQKPSLHSLLRAACGISSLSGTVMTLPVRTSEGPIQLMPFLLHTRSNADELATLDLTKGSRPKDLITDVFGLMLRSTPSLAMRCPLPTNPKRANSNAMTLALSNALINTILTFYASTNFTNVHLHSRLSSAIPSRSDCNVS